MHFGLAHLTVQLPGRLINDNCLTVNVPFSIHYLYHISSTMQRPTLTTNTNTNPHRHPNPNITLARLVVAWYWMCGISRER